MQGEFAKYGILDIYFESRALWIIFLETRACQKEIRNVLFSFFAFLFWVLLTGAPAALVKHTIK